MIDIHKAELTNHILKMFDFKKVKGKSHTLYKTTCIKDKNHYMYYKDGKFFCPICKFNKELVELCCDITNTSEWDMIERIFRVKLKMDVSGIIRDKTKIEFEHELLYQINYDAMIFFKEQLYQNKEALKYIKDRGITDETIEKFNIGYAPKYNKLYKVLSQNFRSEDLELAGVIGINEDDNKPYDIFKDRIIFPIIDIDDAILGFGGRTISNSSKKYINTKTTPIFQKSNHLYALNAIDQNKKYEKMLVCEGYMDVIALHQEGIDFAVGTLGTALTPNHMKLLNNYTDTPVAAFDGDDAGIKAAERSLSKIGKLHGIILPDDLDPDDYIKKYGADNFIKYLDENIVTWHEFWLSRYNQKGNIFDYFLKCHEF